MANIHKKIYISNDGTKTGIRKENPTAPVHIGDNTQVDGTATISGNVNITSGGLSSNDTITANNGVILGNFTGIPASPMLRKNGVNIEWWNGTSWIMLGFGNLDMRSAMQPVFTFPSVFTWPFSPETPSVNTPSMALQDLTAPLSAWGMASSPVQESIKEANA